MIRKWNQIRTYVGEAGVRGCLSPAVLQIVSPVKVLALIARGPLQTYTVLQTPLHGQDAGCAGVTHHKSWLSVNREIVQRHLEVHLIVDLKRGSMRTFNQLPYNNRHTTLDSHCEFFVFYC